MNQSEILLSKGWMIDDNRMQSIKHNNLRQRRQIRVDWEEIVLGYNAVAFATDT